MVSYQHYKQRASRKRRLGSPYFHKTHSDSVEESLSQGLLMQDYIHTTHVRTTREITLSHNPLQILPPPFTCSSTQQGVKGKNDRPAMNGAIRRGQSKWSRAGS